MWRGAFTGGVRGDSPVNHFEVGVEGRWTVPARVPPSMVNSAPVVKADSSEAR